MYNSFSCTSYLASIPKKAGCWKISGDFYVYVLKRPNWLNRKITKLLLGWEWEDSK